MLCNFVCLKQCFGFKLSSFNGICGMYMLYNKYICGTQQFYFNFFATFQLVLALTARHSHLKAILCFNILFTSVQLGLCDLFLSLTLKVWHVSNFPLRCSNQKCSAPFHFISSLHCPNHYTSSTLLAFTSQQ